MIKYASSSSNGTPAFEIQMSMCANGNSRSSHLFRKTIELHFDFSKGQSQNFLSKWAEITKTEAKKSHYIEDSDLIELLQGSWKVAYIEGQTSSMKKWFANHYNLIDKLYKRNLYPHSDASYFSICDTKMVLEGKDSMQILPVTTKNTSMGSTVEY